MTSQFKTFFLLALLSALIIFMGGAMGGRTGITIALGFAMAMNIGSYWFSDKIALGMYRARELAPDESPALHRMVEELAHEAGVPKPKVYIVPEATPNAFATGRNPEHSAVAVTEGILRLLSPEEMRGVLAHEMSHIANRDILLQTVAVVMASAFTSLAGMFRFVTLLGNRSDDREGGLNPLAALVMAILAPLAAALIQMAISRSREYLADATGARISRDPLALASALGKLESYNQRMPMRTNPATESMFIVSPLTGNGLASLFSTHPPVRDRIARLEKMAD